MKIKYALKQVSQLSADLSWLELTLTEIHYTMSKLSCDLNDIDFVDKEDTMKNIIKLIARIEDM